MPPNIAHVTALMSSPISIVAVNQTGCHIHFGLPLCLTSSKFSWQGGKGFWLPWLIHTLKLLRLWQKVNRPLGSGKPLSSYCLPVVANSAIFTQNEMRIRIVMRRTG